MALLTTVQARLALILADANTDVVGAWSEWMIDLDAIQRPAWVIFDQGGQYNIRDLSGTGDAHYTESYRLNLISKNYGQGLEDEYELQTRTIVSDTITYLLQHEQLGFSDTRELNGSALPPLAEVLWFDLTREAVGLYTMGDVKHWGCNLSITVYGRQAYDPVYIPR